MKKKYRVKFKRKYFGKDPLIDLMAKSAKEAKILAQAERIKAGQDYEIESVWQLISETSKAPKYTKTRPDKTPKVEIVDPCGRGGGSSFRTNPC